MHVLFLSTRSPLPMNGGHPLRTFHTLQEAAKRHYVTFVTFIQHPEEWDGRDHIREMCDNVLAFEAPADASRFALGTGLLRNIASNKPFVARKYDVQKVRSAIRHIKNQEIVDLYHFDMLPLSVYASEAVGKPTVLVHHNVEYKLLERRSAVETGFARTFWTQQARRLKKFEAESLERVTRSIAVSDMDAALPQDLSPLAHVHTVPNGVDTKYFQPGIGDPDPHEVVFVGSMTHQPNVDSVQYFCSDIWPLVRQGNPNARFSVVGAYPPDSVKALGSIDGVSIIGQVPDIRPYVHSAAVYVVPLRIGGGTRLKILDAMAMSKAIVSTSIGCEGLEVANGLDIVIADTPEEFARRILELLRDPERRESLGVAARGTVEARYTWDRIGELQEAVYQSARAAVQHVE